MKVDLSFTKKITESDKEDISFLLFEHGCLGIYEVVSAKVAEPVFIYSAFFEDDADSKKKIKELQNELALIFPPSSVDVSKFKGADWSKKWRKYFHKIKIGKRIVIGPPWELKGDEPADSAASGRRSAAKKINIIIEPGMAFGTGTHETTQMCLEFLEDIDVANKRTLDLGAGSAALSIGAVKFGAASAEAVECDPEAISNAKKNLSKNKVAKKIRLFTEDGKAFLQENKKSGYDIIFCNMLIKEFAPLVKHIAAVMKNQKDGVLILSGYLKSEEDEIVAMMLRSKLKLVSSKQKGDWASGLYRLVK